MFFSRDILYVKLVELNSGDSLADCVGGLKDDACSTLYINYPNFKDVLDLNDMDCTGR